MQNKLVAVLCGMPFSGTTFLSRILCSHHQIESGFECGMLFEDSPKEFINRKKFYSWMMSHERPYNWKLTKEEMTYITNTDSFYEAYARIVEKCHLYNSETNLIIDKTPAYCYRLRNVMTKVEHTPFIVVRKNVGFQFHSYKSRGKNIEEFEDLYLKHKRSIDRAVALPILNKRLLIINFEDLQVDLAGSIKKIFQHIIKFNEIDFNAEEMIDKMIESINSDIKSNQKKLRKKFNFNEVRENYLSTFDEKELKVINKLESLSK